MPNDTELPTKFDVFIIGGGIIACTFARQLLDAGMRVGMADAGDQFSVEPGENLKNYYNFQHDPDQYGGFERGQMHPVSVPPASAKQYRSNALNPRQDPTKNLDGAGAAYCVGGMSVHWTCAIPRQHPTAERIDTAIIPATAWDYLYPRAEKLLRRNVNVHVDSLRHQAVKKRLSALWPTVADTPLAAERRNPEYVYYSGANVVLGPWAKPDKVAALHLRRQHRVTRLIYRGGKVVAALLRNLVTKEEVQIEADSFVVAAGWLHTAQILWNSWVRPPALGRYLTDHAFTACQVELKPDIVAEIRDEAMARGVYLDPADPVPIPMSDPPPHLYLPVFPDQHWQGLVFREAFQTDPPTPTVDIRLIVDLKFFGMIDPVPDNRVVFEPDIFDRLGMPQPTFEFQLGPDDQQREAQMMQHMQDVALTLGTYLPTSHPWRVPLGASTHTMGATRMGIDPQVSVVDPYSRVWGFDNLYLGGNCVLPNRNACNPTLTSLALALRACDHLISGGSPPPPPAPQP